MAKNTGGWRPSGKKCPTCGGAMQIRVQRVQVSWFRGEDEFHEFERCPHCLGKKNCCYYCGKLFPTVMGLTNHMKDKKHKSTLSPPAPGYLVSG